MWDPESKNKLSPEIAELLRPVIKEQDNTLKDRGLLPVNTVIKDKDNNNKIFKKGN